MEMNTAEANEMQSAIACLDKIFYTSRKAHCEYIIMDEAYLETLQYPELVHDNRGNPLFVGDAYTIITCENGYKYYVNVTADSVYTACAETMTLAAQKLG